MDSSLDKTALETISLLEARMLRIEHVLGGGSSAPLTVPVTPDGSVGERIGVLERDFNRLIARATAFGELLTLCRSIASDCLHVEAVVSVQTWDSPRVFTRRRQPCTL